MKLPVPRWALLQVGIAKVPRYNASTELVFNVAEAVQQLHSGANYDFYRHSRSPFASITFKHTGTYISNPNKPVNLLYPYEELDHIESQKGVYVPFLFAKDYTSLPPCMDCCYTIPDCWTLAWAWGKVQKVGNVYSVEDYASPMSADVSLEGVLEGPLREVTYSRWRYGLAAVPTTAMQRKMIRSELEIETAEAINQWWVPCEMPLPTSDKRFWPRDLYSVCRTVDESWFFTEFWDMKTIVAIRAPTESILRVWGNTRPASCLLARGDAKFTIINQAGSFTFDMGLSDGDQVFIDPEAGRALRMRPDTTIEVYTGLSQFPFFEFYENRVFIESGMVTIGLTPQWIN